MHKIAVLDFRLHTDAQAAIQKLAANEVQFWTDRCPEEERVGRTGDAEIVLITPWEKIDKAYLDACPQLKYIGLCGTSTANIDLDELSKHGIAFSNIVSHTAKVSVAEFFFMQLIGLARGIGKYQWKAGESHTLGGKRLGIIGLGDVGRGFAQIAPAFNMPVSYYSPHRKTELESEDLEYVEKKELLETCDVVVLCSSTNVVVLKESDFALIKSGSILIQACSGTPFDKPAFKQWVAQAGNYALFDMSAGVKNHQEYKNIDHVIFSDAVAGDTYESNQRRGQRAVANLQNFLKHNAA